MFGDSNIHYLGQNSSLGSRKIKFITWINQSSEYSLLGSDSKLGSEQNRTSFPGYSDAEYPGTGARFWVEF